MALSVFSTYPVKLGPVMVTTSPETAVVIFCDPAILTVSPSDIRVPVLSSPTNVIPCAVVPVMVNVSPDTAVVIPLLPAILTVSPMFKSVPVESSPTTVMALYS